MRTAAIVGVVTGVVITLTEVGRESFRVLFGGSIGSVVAMISVVVWILASGKT